MKILVTAPYYYPKIGGLETYARQLALALHAEGEELVIAASNHESRRSRTDSVDGMKVYRLGAWFKLFNTPVNPLWFLNLRSIIRAERPDVILTHSPVPTIADATVLAAGRTPVVLFYHAASLLKKDAPVFNAIARTYNLYQSLTFGRVAVIAAVSDFVAQSLPARYRKKAVVVPNAVWSSELAAAVPAKPTELVFVASLARTHSWKGLDQIIEAIATYKRTQSKSIHLNVIGDGDYRAHYEEKVRSLGVEPQVTFHGALHGAAKNSIIARSRALICYPTTSNDAFPTVMLEGWALGVLVVAAAIGPIPSLLRDSIDGLLVAPDDPAALAGALARVVAMPSSAIATMTKAGTARVQTEYTWEIQATRVRQMLEAMA